uniref:Putative secreted protein n=1 Tax=Anopheles marajoara TaxID=58244 RepID=A0A2M4C959_9DIPT
MLRCFMLYKSLVRALDIQKHILLTFLSLSLSLVHAACLSAKQWQRWSTSSARLHLNAFLNVDAAAAAAAAVANQHNQLSMVQTRCCFPSLSLAYHM